jgi:predicted acylesterase/phospholipase RssA
MSKFTGLVLQGGGARGAFECGAISRLYANPRFGIHAVAGASIGAINAACLVGGRSREELGVSLGNGSAGESAPDGTAPWAVEELWRRLKIDMSLVPAQLHPWVQKLGNHLCLPRIDYFDLPRWTSCYDTEPMRDLLIELIDFRKLNSSPVKVTLVAVDVESGQLTEFKNWNGQSGLTVDHIMASASLPPEFPMTVIDSRRYWDGGLFDNTPMESVIDALVQADQRRPAPAVLDLPESDDNADLLVYLLQLMPGTGEIPEDLMEVCDRQMQIIFANKSGEDADRVGQINDYVTLVRRLVDGLPTAQAARFREDPLYRKLSHHRVVRIVTIPMQPGGISSGADDFSTVTIDARIAEGDAAAARANAGRQDTGASRPARARLSSGLTNSRRVRRERRN